MEENVIVGGKLIYKGPRTKLASSSDITPRLAYAFYSSETGEVWAYRIPTGPAPVVWHYLPRQRPWLLIGYEEVQGDFPIALAEFIIEERLHDPDCPISFTNPGLEGTPDGGLGLRENILNPHAD